MKRLSIIPLTFFIVNIAYTQTNTKSPAAKSSSVCADDCTAKNTKNNGFKCKLASPELKQRKETVLASLKKQILQKKELKNGFAYQFNGSDSMVDELTTFVKTERECCGFFVFNLSISGDKSEAWLEITGPKGAKEVIKTELEL